MGTLNVDYTFFIQLANFIITLVVLNFILIKPVREQISSRKELTDGYLSEIEKFTEKSNQKLSSYEAALDNARVEAASMRDTLREEGHNEESTILDTARTKASNFLEEAKSETAKKADATTKDLMKQTPVFAKQVVSKILQ